MHLEWETKLICICGLLLFSVQKFQSIICKEWTLYIRLKIHTYIFQTSHHHSIASNGMQICFSSVSWYAEIVHGLDKASIGLTHRQAKQNFMIAGVSLNCNLRLADDTIVAWVIQKSETMVLSMVNFITDLTVCHPHDLKDGERDSRNSATSADKSMGGEGAEKYSKPDSVSSRHIQQHDWTLHSGHWVPVTFNKEMAPLTAPMSSNTEEESNGREAAKKYQGLKPSHDLNKY